MDYNSVHDFVLEDSEKSKDHVGKNSRPTKEKITSDSDKTSPKQIEQDKIQTSYLSAEFTCRFCTKTFRHKRTLTAHEKVHSQVQKFVCQVCNMTFMHNKSLIRHKKAHSQAQNFACQACNKIFRQKYNLQAHERTQHRSCNWCDYKTLTSKENIDEHIYYKHPEEAMQAEVDEVNLANGFEKEPPETHRCVHCRDKIRNKVCTRICCGNCVGYGNRLCTGVCCVQLWIKIFKEKFDSSWRLPCTCSHHRNPIGFDSASVRCATICPTCYKEIVRCEQIKSATGNMLYHLADLGSEYHVTLYLNPIRYDGKSILVHNYDSPTSESVWHRLEMLKYVESGTEFKQEWSPHGILKTKLCTVYF